MATYYRRDEWVQDAMGNAISGAGVYVASQPANTTTVPPSPLVQLYADSAGLTPLTQPVITDGYGHAAYYLATGIYTVVYSSPQIQEVILPDQSVNQGGVSIPVAVNQGGTGATTAGQAIINLGAAASGANVDITSLGDIPNTAINSTGYLYGGTFGSTNSVQVANQTFAGTGYTGMGLGVSSPTGSTIIGAGFIGTSGIVSAQNVSSISLMEAKGGLRVGNSGATALITPDAPDIPLMIGGEGVVNSAIGVQLIGPNIAGKGLLAFGASGGGSGTYVVQTTVGAAGGASAQPATPLIYIPVMVNIAGTMTEVVIAAHRPS